MIKTTTVICIVYAVLHILTQWTINGLDPIDKFRFARKRFTKGERNWFVFLGFTKFVCVIMIAISAISLVLKYL